MSQDILSKLKSLHEEVRTRIEASADYKAMMAVEGAIKELTSATSQTSLSEHTHDDAPAQSAPEVMAASSEVASTPIEPEATSPPEAAELETAAELSDDVSDRGDHEQSASAPTEQMSDNVLERDASPEIEAAADQQAVSDTAASETVEAEAAVQTEEEAARTEMSADEPISEANGEDIAAPVSDEAEAATPSEAASETDAAATSASAMDESSAEAPPEVPAEAEATQPGVGSVQDELVQEVQEACGLEAAEASTQAAVDDPVSPETSEPEKTTVDAAEASADAREEPQAETSTGESQGEAEPASIASELGEIAARAESIVSGLVPNGLGHSVPEPTATTH